MTTETAAVETTDKKTAILDRSVVLILTCGYLGNNRKVALGGLDMKKDGADLAGEKDELRASKQLFAVKDLKPCEQAIWAVKATLRSLSVDGGLRMFGPGAYLLPRIALKTAVTAIEGGMAQLSANVETLVGLLPQLIETRKQKLGPLFDAAEYPSADDVREAYRIRYHFVSFGAPDRLEEVDAAIAEQAQADWDAKLSTAYDDVVAGLRLAALTVMRELKERLTPGVDGKPKALRATALADLQELLGNLPMLNSVAGDAPLVNILAGVGGSVTGVSVETLRDAPAVRTMLLQKAEEAITQLDALVVAGPRRAMRLPAKQEVA